MPKRFFDEFVPPQTLTAAGDTATFDVGSYDGWQIRVVTASVTDDITYTFSGAPDGENYTMIVNQAVVAAAGVAIGTGGTVTIATPWAATDVNYVFARAPYVHSWAATTAKTVQFKLVTVDSGTPSVTVSIIGAYSDR